MAYAEIVAPKTGNSALEYGVIVPVVYGAAFGAVFDIKARWAAHVKRHHVVVSVPSQSAR